MKIVFKIILPVIIMTCVTLVLLNLTGLSFLGNTILIFLIPLTIIYTFSVFTRQLNLRNKQESLDLRTLIIITSLINILSVLAFLIRAVFQLPGYYIYNALVIATTFIAVSSSLIFFIKNYRHFNHYVPYEFLIVLLPSFLVIGIYFFSSHVPQERYAQLSRNRFHIEMNNQYILEHYEVDSIGLKNYEVIDELETSFIAYSGGYTEEGYLINASNVDKSLTFLYIMSKNHRQLNEVAEDFQIPEREISWLNHEYLSNMTVTEAVIKLELLKNRVLLASINLN